MKGDWSEDYPELKSILTMLVVGLFVESAILFIMLMNNLYYVGTIQGSIIMLLVTVGFIQWFLNE